ncbi:hypothetical protein H2509_09200 [Stappia sp. F7233]|uniref:Uncharacterized protein n=1 Tax=Stappia albiluteola TaxID=2758565 RepID=A0A839AEG8_9HYPH|nr:hypothetical protein [Stappia albiluteola]MBA5777302.1 hypothetical protein [Stappia albiluteola]
MEFPKVFYHGTTGDIALAALRDGIKPGVDLASASSKQAGSPSSHVYLTDACAVHFAAAAATRSGAQYAAILEIDGDHLDPARYRADEYAYEQIRRGSDGIAGSPLERAAHYRGTLDNDLRQAVETLDAMGSFAYEGTIPAHAIMRVALLQMAPPIEPVKWSINSSVSVQNYHFVWMEHSAITHWVMNDRWPNFRAMSEIYRFWLSQLTEYRDRVGIKVSANPRYVPADAQRLAVGESL